VTATGDFTVKWIDAGREPQCAPDPAFPTGVDIDASRPGEPSCRVELPYPARRCGAYDVTCNICGLRAATTTAGRPDDPRSLTVPCQLKRAA
jgi:hypothetical protein